MSRDVNVFDDYNLSNVKAYLNSEFYTYDLTYDLNLDLAKSDTPFCLICIRVFIKHIMESIASKH